MEKTKLTGRIVTCHDPEYEQARINNNLNPPKFPKKIVFCQEVGDVLNALKWVRENHIPFRVRSGRHSYENFSLVNDGLIIDVSEMCNIQVDLETMTATIEAGANLGQVYNKLWKYGTTIPGGTESSVGLAGLTLGGGIGMLTRNFGLTCDNLLEIEMVRACGHKGAGMMKANENLNRDLFWACRGGGGGNFGIVTSFTFKVHPISTVSIFSISWEWEDFEATFDAWQKWAPVTDERLTSEIECKSKAANEIIAQGEFVGSSSKLKQLLQPLMEAGTPINVMVKEVPYIEAVRFFDEPSGNIPANRKRSGSFIKKLFPRQAIKIMKQFLSDTPNENASIWHQSLKGEAGRVSPNDTAFYYREALIAQEYLATWTNPSDERQNLRWIEGLRNALLPYTTGDYVNWPDRFIKDWPTAYYGENFSRLRKVKTEYDPFDVFTFPQSIPPYKRWFL